MQNKMTKSRSLRCDSAINYNTTIQSHPTVLLATVLPSHYHPFIFLNCINLNCWQDHNRPFTTHMNRSKQSNLKRQSKDKPNERHHNYHKKEREKQHDSNNLNKIKGSSLKIGKTHQSSSEEKGRNANNVAGKRKLTKNNILETNPINMKKELKMLLNKNTLGKTKLSVAAPDILKKIEENCRALKKIDSREHDHSQKKSSKHSKESKSFKHSAVNSKSELMNHKHFTRSKEGQHEPIGILKNNRYSYEMDKERKCEESKQGQGFSKHQLQSKSKNTDMFKNYRKFLQNDELKIEKSSKNTNYNTNQSRNSSSLHNSHGISNVLQTIAKNRKIEERFEKVQSIIKNQQSYFERSKESKRSIEVQHPQRPDFALTLDKGVKERRKVLDIKDFEVNDVFIKSNNCKAEISQNNHKQQAISPQHPKPQHHFQRSKYYVQPIPPFKRRTQAHNLEDSLLGCEITLIQNNIIDDSQLPDLQL